MKQSIILFVLFMQAAVYGQQNININFVNDYKEPFHLALIIYTPDGKNQTRISDLKPNEIKSYSLPDQTEIFVVDDKQEAFAMKGNDIKQTSTAPFIVLRPKDNHKSIKLSAIGFNSAKTSNRD
ncbi:MAG: hypothetical protein CFE24_00695 [Flavobacterium sp. BFFFF2]|nr:MAG: hypothetical protein CFE24_00695 [Flavobacterium sp. BFFFF2]